MLSKVLAGQYEKWQGLPPHLAVDQLARKIGATQALASVERNRIASRFRVYALQRANVPKEFAAWVPIGEDSVAIVEIEDPVCADVERTLAELEAPEAALDNERLAIGYVVREMVYASRGIVLSVGRPSSALADRRERLLHVRLFPPMTLQRYLTEVGEATPALPNTHP